MKVNGYCKQLSIMSCQNEKINQVTKRETMLNIGNMNNCTEANVVPLVEFKWLTWNVFAHRHSLDLRRTISSINQPFFY